MNAKVEDREFRLDGLKWLFVIAVVIGGAVANAYYADQFELLYRVLAMLALGLVAAYVAVNTHKGHSFWSLLKAAQVEVRKVVWPTRQETTQTTLIVVAVVLVTALVLWALDSGIGYLASLVIG